MIPPSIKEAIDRYVDTGCPTGSFLYAVFTNDLFEACARADMYNGPTLQEICKYIYNWTPAICCGSKMNVENWIRLHKEDPGQAQLIAGADAEKRRAYIGEVP